MLIAFPFLLFVVLTRIRNINARTDGRADTVDSNINPISFDTLPVLPQLIPGTSYDGKLQAQSQYSIETIPSSYSGVDSVEFPRSPTCSSQYWASPPHSENSY